ncbi:PRC-barrel domain-containing protein [Azospirillum doebereinerae]|nr:PRC-barrel domain-containing protein [Azospirillum doebereinerae]
MNMKHVLATVVALGLGGAGSALAQQSAAIPGAAGDYREVKDDKLVVPGFNLTVDQIDDMNVMGANNAKIGEVEEVLMNAAGQPVAVVVDVENSVGIGDKEVVVGLDQLRLDGGTLVTALSNGQIAALPTWHD